MSRRPERGGRPAWESEADIMMEKTEQGLGRLCVIGCDMNEDALKALFKA